jgi:hypothetical protein
MKFDPNAPISLLDLVTEESVDAYVDWQLDQRGTVAQTSIVCTCCTPRCGSSRRTRSGISAG